jgi:hypothetical protein
MTRQAEIADKQMGIIEKQLLLAEHQTDLMARQHGLQRTQFFAEYRPRVVLKDVFFTTAGNFDELTFELANNGGNAAKITGGFIALDFVSDHRQFKNVSRETIDGTEGVVLEVGQLRQFPRKVRDEVQFFLRFPDARRVRNLDDPDAQVTGDLFFFGALTYTDERGEFGIERLSVFRREWVQSEQGFRRTGNPDHEFAD